MSENIKQMVGKIFNDVAEGIETGNFGSKAKVGVTLLGSEHGVENVLKGAEIAQANNPNIEVAVIGPASVETDLVHHVAEDEDEQHKVMESLLADKELDGVVTMHYNFPIGVSTVGRVVTPALGKEMIIATTTGTSSTHRIQAMVRNAIHGIITAKSIGIEKPTLGILNVEGARQVERALNQLKDNGYEFEFSESMRSDGGCVMRGNDLLTGTPDVMVTDSLTGNILMKMFSSYTTGGSIEASGFGYGPGVGEGFKNEILIVSRASGSSVIANAIQFGGELAKGNLIKVSEDEFNKANKKGLQDILCSLQPAKVEKEEAASEKVEMPEKEIVTGSISGIEIMDLDDAVEALWKEGVYAESGMGCTGPIVMVNESKVDQATEILTKAGFVG